MHLVTVLIVSNIVDFMLQLICMQKTENLRTELKTRVFSF